MCTNVLSIYSAGPLFTIAERRWNRRLCDELTKLGYRVFLPQESEANGRAAFVHKEVAKDDQRGVYESNITIVNLDGSMVDDGSALEAGMAIGRDKITVGYRTDFRVNGDDPGIKINLMFNLLDEVILFSSLEHDTDDAEAELALLIHQAIGRTIGHREHLSAIKSAPIWR